MDEQQTFDQFQAQSEYLRKLNQQIVQKDNIIKLLQLQIKNLEEQGQHGDEALVARLQGDVERKDEDLKRLRRLLDRAEQRNRSLQEHEGEEGEVERLSERLRSSEAEANSLRLRLSEREDEVIEYIAELERLRESSASSRGDSEILRSLRDENESLRRDLDLTLNRLAPEADLAGRASERRRISELEAALDEALRGGGDPIEDGVELARLREHGEKAEREAKRLRGEVEVLRGKLEETRREAQAGFDPEGFQLVQEVIEVSQRFDELRRSLDDDLQAEGHWEGLMEGLRRLWDCLGVSPIATVGHAFDGELHQAVEVIHSNDYDHDSVVAELGPGFTAAGTVIKPADVVVCRNPYYCEDCSKIVAEGSRFCNICGTRILGEPTGGKRDLPSGPSLSACLDLAWGQERARDFAEARRSYERALAIDASSVRALYGLARLDEAEGHFREALERYQMLLDTPSCPTEVADRQQRVRMKLEIVDRLQRLL